LRPFGALFLFLFLAFLGARAETTEALARL
jgi:hypothetical protein